MSYTEYFSLAKFHDAIEAAANEVMPRWTVRYGYLMDLQENLDPQAIVVMPPDITVQQNDAGAGSTRVVMNVQVRILVGDKLNAPSDRRQSGSENNRTALFREVSSQMVELYAYIAKEIGTIASIEPVQWRPETLVGVGTLTGYTGNFRITYATDLC